MTINMIKPYPGMKIYEDVTFIGGVYNFFEQEGITICADNITVNGNGAVLVGGKIKGSGKQEIDTTEFTYGYGEMIDSALGYYGTGIQMKECSGVTIQHLQVKGFLHGLYMEGCTKCLIEHNDFSYNYHNPDWGWEEHQDVGGMLLIDSKENQLIANTASNVWSALVLRNSHHNLVQHNCCSHTSNVGLRLWLSSHNTFEDNDFSWGIRKDPNEVHARDSSCVLIESASSYNVFKRNDMRYGGDGLFIRSLNNMMSMYNVFEENDTSYANNNAIEAWDAHNTYIRNKANYSSYGFWLGCSDHTILQENEVIGNGSVFRNAPESFGNAGIAVVNGSGNDFIVERNVICDNYGPGIAIRHTFEVPSRNWIIKENIIQHNHDDERGFHGYGIYIKNAMNIHILQNQMGNDHQDVFLDEHASMCHIHQEDREVQPFTWTRSSKSPLVKEEVSFQTEGFDSYEVYFDDGQIEKQGSFVKSFQEAGRYRVFANGYGKHCLGCKEEVIYVRARGEKVAEAADEKNWVSDRKQDCILRTEGLQDPAVLLHAKHMTRASFRCSFSPVSLKDKTHLSFYYCYLNDFIDWKQEVALQLYLMDAHGEYLKITSAAGIFQQACSKANEAKYEWEYLQLPLTSTEDFTIEYSDSFDGKATSVNFLFETPQPSTLYVKLDDLTFEQHDASVYEPVLDAGAHQIEELKETIQFSSAMEACYDIFKTNRYHYDQSPRWISSAQGTEEALHVTFAGKLPVDGLEISFYADQSTTFLPLEIKLSDESGVWCTQQVTQPTMKLLFDRRISESLTIQLKKQQDTSLSCYQCVWLHKRRNEALLVKDEDPIERSVSDMIVKLNVETWPKSSELKDLQYAILPVTADLKNAIPLLRRTLPYQEILPGKETRLPIQGTLMTNKEYALVMWIDDLAKDVQDGSYYRWVGSGIEEINGRYGYLNQDGIINQGKTGWGDCYLKVLHDEGILDQSCASEGLGNRFGLPQMEKLYQTFRLPGKKTAIFTADYGRRHGLPVEGKRTLYLWIPKPDCTLHCYLVKDTAMQASINGTCFVNQDTLLEVTFSEDGWQELVVTSEDNEILFIE